MATIFTVISESLFLVYSKYIKAAFQMQLQVDCIHAAGKG
jgi:hypothetical protein